MANLCDYLIVGVHCPGKAALNMSGLSVDVDCPSRCILDIQTCSRCRGDTTCDSLFTLSCLMQSLVS